MSSRITRQLIIVSVLLILFILLAFLVLYFNNIILIGRIEEYTNSYIVVKTYLKSADQIAYPNGYLKYKIYSSILSELPLDDNDMIIAVVSSSSEQSIPPGVTGYYITKLPIE